MCSALETTKAIAKALQSARGAGQRPGAILMNPALQSEFESQGMGYWWAGAERFSLLLMRVEVDAATEGWSLRLE